ncbi:hypothetical protein LCGC14_1795610 [marine sediment metagenome]|uniref:Uncharacterized protein n=1 Tax=marine sediment metagenome TaxID=412755 RepID=A0A0F9HDV7_9ZZZZ
MMKRIDKKTDKVTREIQEMTKDSDNDGLP